MRVLVVEDDATLADQLKTFLSQKGFVIDFASTGKEGLYIGSEFQLDAAVIDLGLPDFSGIELIKQLRAADKDFPILILTARTRWQEKVEGLESGADDYLIKPFHYEELLARLKALIRRYAGKAAPVFRAGPIELDMRSQVVRLDEEVLDLTAYEYKVLEYMFLHQGEVVSKSDLTEHLYEQDFDRDSNVIEVFVGRLRKKLDPDGTLKPFETLRGRGYRFIL